MSDRIPPPVKRGLVLESEQWEWSSYQSYAYQEQGNVKITLILCEVKR